MVNKNQFDVLIAGGGPAGCALAITLKRENPALRVGIAEKSEYEALRIGETLPPQTQVLLQGLGLWNHFPTELHLPSHSTRSAWGSSSVSENDFLFIPQQRGWHLDRRKFDAFLAEEAEKAGVTLMRNTRFEQATREQNQWSVKLKQENNELIAGATFVADCTGRSSSFLKSRGDARIFCDRLTGLMAIGEARPGDDRSTLVESVEDGWWYSAMLPDGKLVAGLFTDAGIAKEKSLQSETGWNAALAQAPHTSNRLKNWLEKPLQWTGVRSASSSFLANAFGEGWIAAGDASLSLDPLSSQGIFQALSSGKWAAFALLDYFSGESGGFEKYNRLRQELIQSYLHTRREYYRMEQRWPDAPFWKRRHEFISIAPQALVKAAPGQPGRNSLFVSAEMLNQLVNELQEAVPAHVAASRLSQVMPFAQEGRAIIALQQLIEDEFLQVTS